ncbi:regulator of chromosome condensation [Ixodes scapularis]
MPRTSKPPPPSHQKETRKRAAKGENTRNTKTKGKDSKETKAKKARLEVPKVKRRKLVGQAYSLGTGDVGQLGLGPDVLEKSRPAPVPGHTDVVDVVAGGMHSLLLSNTGQVFSFGCNDEGALGRPTSSLDDSETTPGAVELPEPVTHVSAGDSHSAALTVSGAVFAWGSFRDSSGFMGLLAAGKSEPKPVHIADGIVQIASGNDHLVLLSKDGRLLTLGDAEQGQLGRVARCFALRGGRKGLGYLLQPMPVVVNKPRGCSSAAFDQVWTGSYVTFARMRDNGALYGFGLNNYYQLGSLASTSTGDLVQFVPTLLTSCTEHRWKRLCGGQHHTMLLDGEGCVYTMGRHDYGRLGLGTDCTEQETPRKVPGLPPYVDISCGDSVSFAVTAEGRVFSWGLGDNHQLGHGDGGEDVHEPKVMTGKLISSKRALLVSGGGQHVLMLVIDS